MGVELFVGLDSTIARRVPAPGRRRKKASKTMKTMNIFIASGVLASRRGGLGQRQVMGPDRQIAENCLPGRDTAGLRALFYRRKGTVAAVTAS